jgi:hypothetical protein
MVYKHLFFEKARVTNFHSYAEGVAGLMFSERGNQGEMPTSQPVIRVVGGSDAVSENAVDGPCAKAWVEVNGRSKRKANNKKAQRHEPEVKCDVASVHLDPVGNGAGSLAGLARHKGPSPVGEVTPVKADADSQERRRKERNRKRKERRKKKAAQEKVEPVKAPPKSSKKKKAKADDERRKAPEDEGPPRHHQLVLDEKSQFEVPLDNPGEFHAVMTEALGTAESLGYVWAINPMTHAMPLMRVWTKDGWIVGKFTVSVPNTKHRYDIQVHQKCSFSDISSAVLSTVDDVLHLVPGDCVVESCPLSDLECSAQSVRRSIIEDLRQVWFEQTGFNYKGFLNRCVAKWKIGRHEYEGLRSDFENDLRSSWFQELTARWNAEIEDEYVGLIETQFKSVMLKRGFRADEINRELRKKICRKRTAHYLQWSVALAIPVVGWIYAAMYLPTDRDFRREVIRELVTPQSSAPLVPCAKLAIRKSVAARDRIPEHKELEAKYEPIENEDLDELVEIYGATINGAPMVYPTSHAQNVHAACSMRMLHERQVQPEYMEQFVRNSRRRLDSFVQKYGEWFTPFKPSRDETYQHLVVTYGGKKAARMIELYDDVIEVKDLVSKLFCKPEVYLGKDASSMKPRMIWMRHQILVVKFGLWMKNVTAALSKAFTGKIYYSCKATPHDIGEWYAWALENFGFRFESDVSSWDGSLAKDMIELERYFLEKIGYPEEFKLVLEHWTEMRAVFYGHEAFLKLNLDYGRRSGDLWTSSFNSLLNVLIVMEILELDWDSEFGIMVLGDDNLVALPTRVDTALIEKRYKNLGMKVAVVEDTDLGTASYCSGLMYPVGGQRVWGNLAFRSLCKLGINHNNHSAKYHKGFLYGIAKSGLGSAGHVPILGAVYRAIIADAEDRKVKARFEKGGNPHKFRSSFSQYPCADTYEFFSLLYGVPIVVILELEEWIEANLTLDHFPCVFTHPTFYQGLLTELGQEPGDSAPADLVFGLDPASYEYVVDIAPRIEELTKLAGARTVAEAVEKAALFGREEDEMLGSDGVHERLHKLFTLTSCSSLELGVAFHREYNRWALKGASVCAKAKHKAAKKKAKGKGQEKAAWRKAVGNVLRAGGGAIGGHFGGPIGAGLGEAVGGALAKISGMGAYEIKTNSLQERADVSFGHGSITLAHREFVGLVYSATDFTTTIYDINPGLYDTVPWASVMSRNYERYEMLGFAAEFVSTAGYLTSTQAQGVLVIATQYDPDASEFVNRREMESYMYTTSGIVTENQLHLVECAPSERPLKEMYLRYGETDRDKRFTDMGRMTVAVEGCPSAGVVLGELWVTYHVKFTCPRLEAHGYSNASWACIENGAYDNNDVLSTIQVTPRGTLPITIGASGSYYDRLVFPPALDHGIFLCVFSWFGSVTASMTLTGTATNASKLSVWCQDAHSLASSETATDNTFIYAVVLQVVDRGAYFTFSSATLPTSGTCCTIMIAQMGDPSPASLYASYAEALERARGVQIVHPTVAHEIRLLNFTEPDELKIDEDGFVLHP